MFFGEPIHHYAFNIVFGEIDAFAGGTPATTENLALQNGISLARFQNAP
jgi:hypothetical protein